MQQDAHEMFNYLINEIAETLLKQKKLIYEKLKDFLPPNHQTGKAEGIVYSNQNLRLGSTNSLRAS
jgi:hypothetical protein